MRRMRLHRLLVVGLLVSRVALAAQTDPVTIRVTPAPGQVLHSRMTLEMTMGFESDGDAPPPLAKPAHATMNIEMTTTVGTPDEQGRYQAHGTIEAASMVLTIDGQTRPLENSMSKLEGIDMTITYAADGRVIDMTTTPALPGADVVKTMLTGVTGLEAPVSLTVGETVTRPFAFSTLLASSANQGMGMSGNQQLTLVSIAPDGADRIAHVTTKMSSSASLQPARDRPRRAVRDGGHRDDGRQRRARHRHTARAAHGHDVDSADADRDRSPVDAAHARRRHHDHDHRVALASPQPAAEHGFQTIRRRFPHVPHVS